MTTTAEIATVPQINVIKGLSNRLAHRSNRFNNSRLPRAAVLAATTFTARRAP